MKERPILFSGALVRAILAGTKTQTRRLILPPLQPQEQWRHCPFGMHGDRLWVREGWRVRRDLDHLPPRDLDPERGSPWYDADPCAKPSGCMGGAGRYRSGRFMPRWASRLTLEVTEIRVERLQEITAASILAEGVVARPHEVEGLGRCPVSAFDGAVYPDLVSLWARGWDKINGKRGPWASNPYVWAVSFRALTCK